MPFYVNKEGANAHAEKPYLLLGKIGREEILPPYYSILHSSLVYKESLDIKSIKTTEVIVYRLFKSIQIWKYFLYY